MSESPRHRKRWFIPGRYASNIEQRVAVCAHESGHCVVAEHCGCRVIEASVATQAEGSWPHVRHDWGGEPRLSASWLIAAAGPAAAQRFADQRQIVVRPVGRVVEPGRPAPFEATPQDAEQQTTALDIIPNAVAVEAFESQLSAQLEATLDDKWGQVASVAIALLEHTTLTGEQVRAAMRTPVEPVALHEWIDAHEEARGA